MYFVFMGVSGSGKSTLAKRISEAFVLPFYEADDFHPESNVTKMASGRPLEDKDREQWLQDLTRAIHSSSDKQAVIACSALTPFVQTCLNEWLPDPPIYIMIEVSERVTRARLDARADHFMPSSLLASQFEALDPPDGAHRVSNNEDLDAALNQAAEIVREYLSHSKNE